MTDVAAFTSFTFGYLPRAIVLARTLRQAHPDWRIVALIVDVRPPGYDDGALRANFDEVVYADELGIPRFRSWMFKHDIVEACTAVKGRMLCRLLDEGADRVVYLDPDIAVFHGLDAVLAGLDTASIILTPHQTEPNTRPAAVQDNELTSLLYGIYNLGFLAVANDAGGRAFAEWWAEQLHRACYDEPERGVFTDQKYCDLVPGLFDGVHVNRDPGCNVASWNVSTRRISISDGGELQANDARLRFFHFTKVFGVGDVMLDKYMSASLAVVELLCWYKRTVEAVMGGLPPSPPWHYGSFRDGRAIPKPARVMFRNRADVMSRFPDPFDPQGDSFHAWLSHTAPAVLAGF